MITSNRTGWITLVISLCALFASLEGLLNEAVYQDILADALIPGTFSQDIISVAASVLLLSLSVRFLKKHGERLFIVMLGLAAYFFYAYGLFVIQGLYTSLYIVYMIIFGLSLYSLVFGLTECNRNMVQKLSLPGGLRKTTAVFFIVIAVMFTALWLSMLIPATIQHELPAAYAVFVLDLCIILPALLIIAVLLLRNRPFASILTGIALVKTLTLILSVVIGEATAPLYDMPINPGMTAIYGVIVVFTLSLGVLYLRNLREEVNQ